MSRLSPRLATVLDALPLKPDLRILEIGCGPGALARAIANRVDRGFVLGIDRSGRAIAQANSLSQSQLKAGRLAFRQAAIEDFVRAEGEEPFDLIVAVRVGALDGRHPEAGVAAMRRIAAALKPGGRLYVDGQETPVNPSPGV